MEDAENIDVTVWFYEVSYTVVLVKENPNFARLLRFVSMPEAWMIRE